MTERGRKLSHTFEASRPDRWMAEITYRTDEPSKVISFEEIADLDPIIERGPDWNEIDQIVITLNRSSVTPRR
jgi:hypothetical protein